MEQQERVAAFVAANDLEAPPAYRLLDLSSEVGELAKDLLESTAYGAEPSAASVEADEVGDALFALLAAADSLDVDADEALDAALAKYDSRLAAGDDPSSGES